MSIRNGLLGVSAAVAGFIVVTVVVTELASATIEFSLLIGLPAGLVGGVVAGVLTYIWLGDEHPTQRRRGGVLAVFGVIFLASLIPLVVVGDLRNSQALPIASATGLLAAIVAYFWYRRPNHNVAQSNNS